MKFLLVLFVAVAFFATGEALECYKCTWPQSGCDDPFDNSASGVTKLTCSGTANVCYKSVAEFSNGTSIAVRGCDLSPLNYQKSLDRASASVTSVSTYFCDSNLCNGVSTTNAAFSMLMVLALPFVFRNHH